MTGHHEAAAPGGQGGLLLGVRHFQRALWRHVGLVGLVLVGLVLVRLELALLFVLFGNAQVKGGVGDICLLKTNFTATD